MRTPLETLLLTWLEGAHRLQGFRASGLQGFRDSGLQGFRDSGFQGFRVSGIQCLGFRVQRLALEAFGGCSEETLKPTVFTPLKTESALDTPQTQNP